MGSDVWGGDENLNCTHDICDCCGAESCTDDFNIEAVRRYRERWINCGQKWFMATAKPEFWDFRKQFAQVPEKWR
jgi:hypothetical protein